jgi:hypothetical protein
VISEKTVELNLTRQVIDWFEFLSHRPHVVVGPSQQQEEGRLGYDVELVGGFRAVLIQFKRANVSSERTSPETAGLGG